MGKDKKNKKDKKSSDTPGSSIEVPEGDNPEISPAVTEPKEPEEGGFAGADQPKKGTKEKKVKEKKVKEESKKKDKKKDKEEAKPKEPKKKDKKSKKTTEPVGIPGSDITPGTLEEGTHPSPGDGPPEQIPKPKKTKPEKTDKPQSNAGEKFKKIIDAIKGPDDPIFKPEPLLSSGNVLYVLAAVTIVVGILLLIAGYTENFTLGEWGQGKDILIQRVFGIMFLGVGLLTLTFKLFFEDVYKLRPRYNTVDLEGPENVPRPTPGKSTVAYNMPLRPDPSMARMYLTSTPEEMEYKTKPPSYTPSDVTPERSLDSRSGPPGSILPDQTHATSTAVLIDPTAKTPDAGRGQKKCVIM